MSGFVGDLSPKQEEALAQFKKNVADVTEPHHDDHFMLRWLRARRFDLKKSEKMVRDHLIWRKTSDIANIFSWNAPEVLVKYYPGGYFGHDKDGCPIFIDNLGPIDNKGFYYSVKRPDIIRFRVQTTEKCFQKLMPEYSKKFSRRVDQAVIVFDMAGIGLKHLWKPAMDTFNEILTVLEANYPESLKATYIVNAPAIFPIAYNLAKPFLSDDTKKKLKVLGRDWKTELLKYIDADQLPKHYGGTCTDPDGDPKCKTQICWGGQIPESYYMKNLATNVDLSQFTTLTVSKGSSMQLDYNIEEEGSMLRWQFWTEAKDIGFGVFFRTGGDRQKASEMEAIVPSERLNSHVIPEFGSITCDKVGTYVIRFDNTYSWVSSKKVSYMIEIVDPDKSGEIEITAL